MRKYKYVDKFMDYIHSHNNYRYLGGQHQTVINYICHDKIGLLMPRYHMWPFQSEGQVISVNNIFRRKYNVKEFIKDYYNPLIVHFPGSYKKRNGTIYHNKYNEYKLKIKEIKSIKIESFKNIINYCYFLVLLFIKILMNL